MENEKLKPCPFCGGEAVVHKFGTGYIAECLECATSMVCESTKAEAVAAWNNRADSNYSVFPNSSNLTYADVEKMVKPLKWINWKDDLGYCSGAEASVSDVCFYVEEKLSGEEDEIKTFDASIEDFQFLGEIATLEAAKSACHDFLVDLVAAALGVERGGE